MSVKITDYKLRTGLEGKSFFTLTLQGGVEIVRSSYGKSYVTIRKASLPTTFDEATCQSLIGLELPGSIEKVECEAYNYTIQQTGEVVLLTHRFEYMEEEETIDQGFAKVYKNSTNGIPAAIM